MADTLLGVKDGIILENKRAGRVTFCARGISPCSPLQLVRGTDEDDL